MVAVQSRLDDVLLATKGKKVEATHQVSRSIPAKCSPTGQSQRLILDVSPEGERELKRADEQYKKLLREAGKVYAKFSPSKAKERLSPAKKDSDKGSAEADDSDSGAEVQSTDEADNTEPAGSSFGGGFAS